MHNKIFGIYKKDGKKIINILGIKIKIKTKKEKCIEKNVINNIGRLLSIAFLHQKTFAGFKNKHDKETIVLLGAGPTLNSFSPLKKAVYVGLNRTFLFDKVKLSYLFAIDKAGIENYYEEFSDYVGANCIKFIGDQNLGKNYQISESYFNKLTNARHYMTTSGFMDNKIALNIETEPLANFCTVSLQAMQFILYTNPDKIYLVGIDCNMTKAGHFVGKSFDCSKRNENSQRNDDNSIIYWKIMKEFTDCYYPNTEIISVNPVGLKGIFKDVYTKEYLKDHPEINPDEVEILEEE